MGGVASLTRLARRQASNSQRLEQVTELDIDVQIDTEQIGWLFCHHSEGTLAMLERHHVPLEFHLC